MREVELASAGQIQADPLITQAGSSRRNLPADAGGGPSIAFRLLAKLGLELSGRLRATTRELRLANQQDD